MPTAQRPAAAPLPAHPTKNGTHTGEADDEPAGRWDDLIAALPKPPQQARSRKTVSALLDAAEEAVDRFGIERFTTDDVAQIAGVSIGTVYNYFHDRVAILDTIRPHRFATEHTLTAIGSRLQDFRARNAEKLSEQDLTELDQLVALSQRQDVAPGARNTDHGLEATKSRRRGENAAPISGGAAKL